jgi:hypothetical protein
MRTSLSCFLLALLFGCGLQPTHLQETPTTQPVSIQNAFRDARPLTTLGTSEISVANGKAQVVNLGESNLLAIPVTASGSVPITIKIKSYIVRRNDGGLALFYPILSFIDEEFRISKTIKPRYEFVFQKNILVNEFTLPAGTKRFLIHTDKEFYQSSFVGVTSEYGVSGGTRGLFGALGGLADAAVLHPTIKNNGREFRFGDAGIISIELN